VHTAFYSRKDLLHFKRIKIHIINSRNRRELLDLIFKHLLEYGREQSFSLSYGPNPSICDFYHNPFFDHRVFIYYPSPYGSSQP
jgi:hypothetical protein